MSLGQALDKDGFALLPHLETHAVTLSKHLGGAADISERDAKITPRLAELELVEAIFVALVVLFHSGSCAFLVQEGCRRHMKQSYYIQALLSAERHNSRNEKTTAQVQCNIELVKAACCMIGRVADIAD
jgi:hypothetical protein